MSGITDINELLGSMQPALIDELFVFCTVNGQLAEYVNLAPIATFMETEGLTLVLTKDKANEAGLQYEGVFQEITLTVHSSLEAVGLTAAVSTKLTSKGISANVIAAYYHDHIFVSNDKAEQALSALKELSDI
ncbi:MULTISPECIES: ACT domain-containing protein [unclassified Psychrobacter]|uniref:ACT domain-containing protein n=1 Tax=unclassified Psychrobacter TaxID=196806 RepID=UPI0025B4E2B3|nr:MULTISPECIES: ACT domain-containing protein [unclassified Psychrobacter]MDN3453063.1 ACT domain-containing protein [Psychrobacter sp. APC 3350]MDN3501460.1 ACT domain-containing protein [Psychrobacter sp. 5A.1]